MSFQLTSQVLLKSRSSRKWPINNGMLKSVRWVLEFTFFRALGTDNAHRGPHTESSGNEHWPAHWENANVGPATRYGEKTHTSQSATGENLGPGERQQQYLEAVLFLTGSVMEKSGWESLVTFSWLEAFFPLFYSRLKQSSVGHQTACCKLQSVF